MSIPRNGASLARAKRILIVDDDAANLKLLRAILEEVQALVFEAGDGVEALEILARDPVDMIIADVLMPRMDGYRLCFEVRKDARLRDVFFVIYTGTYTSQADEKLALEMGADVYLTKPAPAETILETVRALDRQRDPPRIAKLELQQELVLMKEYSHQLVTKLEQRNVDLKRLTSSLHAAHAKLHHLLAHSPAVMYGLRLTGEEFVPYLVSENVIELLGYSVEETLQEPWWAENLHPDDRELAAQRFAEALRAGASRYEYRIRRKDGSYRWVEDTSKLIRDAADQPPKIVGLLADITERKLLEAEVAVRDRQLDGFFSNATAGLSILDRELRFVQVNETLAKINGLPAAAHRGKALREVLPDLSAVLEPVLDKVLRTGEPSLNVEVVGHTAAQPEATRHWLASYFPILGVSGKPHALGSVVIEVTERKQAEEALRQSEAKFRQLADHIQEVFTIVTSDLSETIYVSPAYQRIWGRSVDQLYGSHGIGVDTIHPEDRQRVVDAVDELARGAHEINREYRICRPDGSVRWISDRCFPIHDENGALRRIAGIAKDVTERKQLEERLRRSQKMEAIGELAGGIAHDFNNILGCIVGHTELAVQELSPGDGARTHLDEVLDATRRATDLVLRILTFSRKKETERRPIRLQPVVAEALRLLRASLPATIEVRANLEDDAPAVLADATQIHQIILNLVTNATHAMNGSGKLGIDLRALDVDERFAREHPGQATGRYLDLSVSDTGSGMDAATRERIFDPFFTTKGPDEGTGLGLSVVHGIVDSHDGTIWVESEPGRGSVFHLRFPAYEGASDVRPSSSASIARGASERILFVDDEPSLVQLGRQILERAGYHVTGFTSAVEALEAFRRDPARFDLVFTDLKMPKLSGIELAGALLELRPDLPIVLTTGFGGAMTAATVEALGIRELLMKPATPRSLAESAHRALKTKDGA